MDEVSLHNLRVGYAPRSVNRAWRALANPLARSILDVLIASVSPVGQRELIRLGDDSTVGRALASLQDVNLVRPWGDGFAVTYVEIADVLEQGRSTRAGDQLFEVFKNPAPRVIVDALLSGPLPQATLTRLGKKSQISRALTELRRSKLVERENPPDFQLLDPALHRFVLTAIDQLVAYGLWQAGDNAWRNQDRRAIRLMGLPAHLAGMEWNEYDQGFGLFGYDVGTLIAPDPPPKAGVATVPLRERRRRKWWGWIVGRPRPPR